MIRRVLNKFRRQPAPPPVPRRIGIPGFPGVIIDEIPEALLCPITRVEDPQYDPATETLKTGRFDGGVYGPGGMLWARATNKYLNHDNDPPARATSVPTQELRGRYLYAGLVQNLHFGHFLTENTTRLWGVGHVGEIDGILYLGRFPNQPLAPHVTALFDIFAPDVPLIPIRQPTRAATLLVPQALHFPIGTLNGHQLNRRFFAARLAALPPTAKALPDKVFVSRSRLPRTGARFVMEEAIDANFRAQGYTVIHPQDLPVAEQLQIYARASHLVFSEGSAIHLYALASRPGQKVYFIWRRKVMHPIFNRQIESFGAGPLEGDNHVLASLPSRRFPTQPARAASLIDFTGLGADLAARGYVDAARWQRPDPEQLRRALTALGDIFDIAPARAALEAAMSPPKQE